MVACTSQKGLSLPQPLRAPLACCPGALYPDDLPSTDARVGNGLLKPKRQPLWLAQEDDDYQAYYLNAQDGAGGEEEKAEGGGRGSATHLFAGLKPLSRKAAWR